jgi:hypothetical protein
VGYQLPSDTQKLGLEEKKPEQIFLGLEAGQIVSLADQKIFEPTDPVLVDFYRGGEPLADRII